jgi:integration host factor subunit alpha|tara:strand:+ start:532 stop:840 length:309 start_codon:yes stop_codon:yes gene_type:complete
MAKVNLTKKDLINSVYMQIGFSKNISENLINDFLLTIVENLKNEKKLKLSKFGTFSIRSKKSRIGRNPKTKEQKTISNRNVVLFKASKEFKNLVNFRNDTQK